MIGIPGSGKTTLCGIAFPNHIHISLDTIKEFDSAKKHGLLSRYDASKTSPPNQKLSKGRKIEHVMISDALKNGKNVVVDNTNVTRDLRKQYINLAHRHGATVNAVFFQNIQRAYQQNSNRDKALDAKVLNKFHRYLEPPHQDERFEFIQIMY